jgi:hypothetical protein
MNCSYLEKGGQGGFSSSLILAPSLTQAGIRRLDGVGFLSWISLIALFEKPAVNPKKVV